MGSHDDEYFERQYKDGRKHAFFAENSPNGSKWCFLFSQIAQEEGLVPIFYSGAGRTIIPTPGMSNTLNTKMVDDFHSAKTKVIYVGQPKGSNDYEDHWALSQLKYVNSGHRLLVCASPDYPIEILARYGFRDALK